MDHIAYFEADTLDDLMAELFPRLLNESDIYAATKGKFSELFGTMLVLRNPRARLSRSESKGKVFSALGELFWYLSKENRLSFMEYYLPGTYAKESDDNVTVRSGYGERLFGHNGQNQIENVISLLKKKQSSRRAVIQLFDASDLSDDFKSIPCTCTLQFIVRNNKLNLLVNMRSNDLFRGLPHDVFTFTMLQEIIARSLDVELGEYRHCAGSLHLYEDDYEDARSYIQEGWQSPIAMNPMPGGDPWQEIANACNIEARIRNGEAVDLSSAGLAPYWADLCRLLLVFQEWKRSKLQTNECAKRCEEIRKQMSTAAYDIFINMRIDSIDARPKAP
jgi:thymidylate synthase